jgi:hypothetical protein
MSPLRVEVGPVSAAPLLVLTAGLLVQLTLPQGRSATHATSIAVPSAPALVASPTPVYPQILARPLFSPTRSSVAAGAPAGAQLGDFSVVGTAIARGLALAFVRGPDGKMQTLHIGEQLLDWRLVAVRRDAIVLQSQAQQRVIPVSSSAVAPLVGLR